MKYVVIDWLEVFVDLPSGFSLESFVDAGCSVEPRDYGTRIYNVMATVHDHDLRGGFEIRCCPKSSAVLSLTAAHVKVLNKDCYLNDPAVFLWAVICKYGFVYRSIARCDLACDFVKFDSGIPPVSFVKRVLGGVYRRDVRGLRRDVVQDSWTNAIPNYVAYQNRDVTVRLYDKTLELVQVASSQKRAYITSLWVRSGFIPDVTALYRDSVPHVWRLEFQISSSSKDWLKIGKGEYVENSIDTYVSQSATMSLFRSLVASYFSFWVYKKGCEVDSCSPVRLFDGMADVPRLRPVRPVAVHQASVRLELLDIYTKLRSWSQRRSYGSLSARFESLADDVIALARSASDLKDSDVDAIRRRMRDPELFSIG